MQSRSSLISMVLVAILLGVAGLWLCVLDRAPDAALHDPADPGRLMGPSASGSPDSTAPPVGIAARAYVPDSPLTDVSPAANLAFLCVWADDRTPAAGAKVFSPEIAAVADPRVPWILVADERGEVVLPENYPTEFRAFPLTGGGQLLLCHPSRSGAPPILSVPRGRRLSGRVVGTEGTGLSSLTIYASLTDCEPVITTAVGTTDSLGNFALEGVAADRGYWVSGPECALQGPFHPPTEELSWTITVSATPAGSVRGLVHDSEGTPVPSTRVRLSTGGGDTESGNHSVQLATETDEHGQFRFQHIPATTCVVVAHRDGGGLAAGQLAVKAGHISTLDLVLVRTCRVTGRVESADTGNAVAEAAVRVDHPWSSHFPAALRRTGSTGEFCIDGIPAGSVQLAAWHREHGRTRIELATVEGGEVACTLQLSLGPTVRGRISGDSGEPRAGDRVNIILVKPGAPGDELAVAAAVTDSDGRFQCGGLADALYRVEVFGAGTSTSEPVAVRCSVSPSPEVMEIVVPARDLPDRSLRGKVLTDSGTPVSATLRLRRRGMTSDRLTKTNPTDGAFGFSELTMNGYDLEISPEWYGSTHRASVDLEKSADDTPREFRVPSPGLILLTGSTDAPTLKDSTLLVSRESEFEESESPPMSTSLGAENRLRVAPGRYRIQAWQIGTLLEESEVVVDAGATVVRHVHLRQSHQVEVVVPRSPASAYGAISVLVRKAGAEEVQRLDLIATDDAWIGRLSLAAGRYELEWRRDGDQALGRSTLEIEPSRFDLEARTFEVPIPAFLSIPGGAR